MSRGGARPPRLKSQLGYRLAFLLAIALVPLGLIAVLQSRALVEEARARSEESLLGATRAAAAAELRLIQRASGAAEALAKAVQPLSDDLEACVAMMRDFVDASGVFSFAGFYDVEGNLDCSSAGRHMNFAGSPLLSAALADPRPIVNVNRQAPVSKTSVVYALHPVRDRSGALLGFTGVSVPHDALVLEDAERPGPKPAALMTFDEEGEVLTSSVDFDELEARLPRDRSLKAFVGGRAVAFTAEAGSGEIQTYSVVPLVPGRLYALGYWPAGVMGEAVTLWPLPPATLPVLMWLASLGVAIVAAERLVTRHTRKLTRAITSFASGARIVGEIDLSDAPSEIREAGEAFEMMTDAILRDEAELEDTLHQKEVLLREVHHRVKNNLQLIASIMNMQARHARTEEAREIVRRLQERVMSLATIHRGLYQTTGLADVQADELLADIVRQIVNLGSGPGRRFEVATDFERMRLTPDQAVPLALLVTEALTNAMKYAGGEAAAPACLSVKLRRDRESSALLQVVNSRGPDQPRPNSDEGGVRGLGTQLVDAFAHQIGGEVEREVREDRYALSVRFAMRPLAIAEERRAAEAAAGEQAAGGTEAAEEALPERP